MELAEVVNTQYAFPVGLVLICAIFVFAFGFKASEPPAFNQLSHSADDRKPAGKKRKLKDKKSQPNGHATSVNAEENAGKKQKFVESPAKSHPGKSLKQSKENKPDPEKSRKLQNKTQKVNQKGSTENISLVDGKIQNDKSSGKERKQTAGKSPVHKANTHKSVSEPKEASPVKVTTEDSHVLKEKHANNQQQAKSFKAKDKVQDNNTQKNIKNSLKSKKLEEKPTDYDEGKWEQASSRREKKNRKKDDDVSVSNGVGTVNGEEPALKKEPAKKKNKNVDEPIGSTPEEETVEKDKSAKAKEKKCSIIPAEPKGKEDEDSAVKIETLEPSEQATKTKKKKKPAAGSDPNKDGIKEVLDGVSVQEQVQPSIATKTENKQKQKETEVKRKQTLPASQGMHLEAVNAEAEKPSKVGSEPSNAEAPKVETPSSVVFDELGDLCKDGNLPKKSKKKVRKDQ